MTHEDAPPSTLPPPEMFTASVRASVVDAVVAALVGLGPREALVARVAPAVAAALDEQSRALDERLLRVERTAFGATLSAGVAHELRNPLAVMETSLFILQERLAGDERSLRQVRRLGEQVSLATEIVNDLLDAVRVRPIDARPVDLASVARDAVGRVPRVSVVALSLELSPGIALALGDPRRLGQVVVNVVANAVQALEESGTPSPAVTVRVGRSAESATLTIDDNGPGIPEALLPRLFDPLVSTRAKGTGLGLALSRRIAEAHGGALTAENHPAGGARFTLSLPRREAAR
jgi:two-component system sensor histidine kinase HydH